MTQEIAKIEKNEIASFESGAWGAGANTAQEDLIVAKVLLMQPQSRSVIKKQAEQGEMRNSLDNHLYNNKDGKMDVVIFYQDKVWIVFEGPDEKNMEWKETFGWTPANARLDWSEKKGGTLINRQKAINFYAVVKNDEFSKALPVIIRMKGTSYNTGKRLTTLFATWANDGKPSASKVLTLSAHMEENKKGVFYVWDFVEGPDTTVEEQKVAYKWFVGAKNAQIKVDESEMVEDEDNSSARSADAGASDPVDFL